MDKVLDELKKIKHKYIDEYDHYLEDDYVWFFFKNDHTFIKCCDNLFRRSILKLKFEEKERMRNNKKHYCIEKYSIGYHSHNPDVYDYRAQYYKKNFEQLNYFLLKEYNV